MCACVSVACPLCCFLSPRLTVEEDAEAPGNSLLPRRPLLCQLAAVSSAQVRRRRKSRPLAAAAAFSVCANKIYPTTARRTFEFYPRVASDRLKGDGIVRLPPITRRSTAPPRVCTFTHLCHRGLLGASNGAWCISPRHYYFVHKPLCISFFHTCRKIHWESCLKCLFNALKYALFHLSAAFNLMYRCVYVLYFCHVT